MGIRLENLVVKFGDFKAINDVTLQIPKGKLVSLLGPSGSGKSTTLFTISGIHKPSSGKIFFGDRDVTGLEPEQLGIGLVFQNYALYPHMTVRENILFPLKNLKWDKQEAEKRVVEVAKIVKIADQLDKKPSQLSGGQQQRVAIARALAKKPEILLLDEPLSAIDAKLRKNLQIEIRRIQQELNITTIFVTHDQDEAMSMSDRICLLNNGNIEQVSSPIELYTKPKTRFAASFIGHYNVFSPDEFKQAFHVAAPDNKMTAIRPETIQISTEKPQENDAIHTIYGKIINNRSVGNTLHYHIDVNGITFKVDTLFRSFALYKNDQNVWLSLEKRNCLALED